MSTHFEKLKTLLRELFQLDQADLDFGIYRIMNQKRDEIESFLDTRLLPQVKETLLVYQDSQYKHLKNELEEAEADAKKLGVSEAPKVKELRQKLETVSADTEMVEAQVYSDLYTFFRRYYDKGDFISKRRYKGDTYAIPYSGEEVKLHWANADQYYIKTSEYLRDYTFRLPDGKRVHFKLVEAGTEKDNTKAAAGNERRFILCHDAPVAEENGELFIRFQFVPDAVKRTQDALNQDAVSTFFALKDFNEWRTALGALHPTEKNKNRTLLEKHLNDYTKRNTFDYFIHKDLGGFLRRELDFFIKNEIMHLDDIEDAAAPKVEEYLAKIKAIRRIGGKIIAFLAQLEDFQKRLWLKKKFVVEAHYCLTLDRVPETLYPQIIVNTAQVEEWKRLFAIQDIEGDLTKHAYSAPLTNEFLKENPFLVIDTKHFDEDFKHTLLASMDDLDEQTNGLLIHSENFQALNLLQARYKEQVKCVYIDPPYNTGNDGFVYKDNFQHSSWMSMLENRLLLAFKVLNNNNPLFISIDENEINRLNILSNYITNHDPFTTFIWKSRSGITGTIKTLSTQHEYISCFSKNIELLSLNQTEKVRVGGVYQDDKGFYDREQLRQWGQGDRKEDRPNMYFGIPNPKNNNIEVFPKRSDGSDGRWRVGYNKAIQLLSETNLDFVEENNDWYVYKKIREGKTTFVPYGTILPEIVSTTAEGTKEVQHIFGERLFEYPKPIGLVLHFINLSTKYNENNIILDFYTGSGTTAHATINLNREDGGNRKYILVEVGSHFNTVLKPRIQKVIYSKDWKDGKPVSREGSSHLFKYMRLESYEDTLNNLILQRTDTQDNLLSQAEGNFAEEYMLGYMLNVEGKNSPSLLNIEAFNNPFEYKLNIASGDVGESRPVNVDLIETFNYLLGLKVISSRRDQGFHIVEGTNLKGENILILWRNTTDKSNENVDTYFRKAQYKTKDSEFDLIYINGDNNLENLKRPDETWKVRLIEQEFQRLMFDVQDV